VQSLTTGLGGPRAPAATGSVFNRIPTFKELAGGSDLDTQTGLLVLLLLILVSDPWSTPGSAGQRSVPTGLATSYRLAERASHWHPGQDGDPQ
jgi:hypothetical protein